MRSSLDIRRVLAFLLGLTACGFLSIVEPWYALYAVAFLVALPLAGHVHGRWGRRVLEALPLVWFIVLMVLGIQLFALLAQAMLAAMACRFVLTDNTRDYQGLVLIAVFVTVLSAAGSISVTFGLLLLAEFLIATVLLIMAQFEGRVPHITRGFYSAIVVSALVSFVFAFGVFFALPRWTLGYIKGSPALATQTTGFSKDVTIAPGEVQQDNTVVMRVDPGKGGSWLPLPAYISGMRYTTFSGRQWLVAVGPPESLYPSSGIDSFVVSDQQPDTLTTVYLEPTGTDVVFGLEHITGLRGQFQYVRRDAEGNLFTDTPYYKTIRYDVSSLDQDTVPLDSLVAGRPAGVAGQIHPGPGAFAGVQGRCRARRARSDGQRQGAGDSRLSPCQLHLLAGPDSDVSRGLHRQPALRVLRALCHVHGPAAACRGCPRPPGVRLRGHRVEQSLRVSHCAGQGRAHVGGSPGWELLGPVRPDAQLVSASIAYHEYPRQRPHGLVPERRHI
jgi:hypothetical protein